MQQHQVQDEANHVFFTQNQHSLMVAGSVLLSRFLNLAVNEDYRLAVQRLLHCVGERGLYGAALALERQDQGDCGRGRGKRRAAEFRP